MSILNINLTKTGTGSIKQENLSSQITENNTINFTFAETAKNAKIILTLNGQTLTPGHNKDYTLSGKQITIIDNNHINIGDELLVTYIT